MTPRGTAPRTPEAIARSEVRAIGAALSEPTRTSELDRCIDGFFEWLNGSDLGLRLTEKDLAAARAEGCAESAGAHTLARAEAGPHPDAAPQREVHRQTDRGPAR